MQQRAPGEPRARAAALYPADQLSAVSAFTPVPVVTPSPIGAGDASPVVGPVTPGNLLQVLLVAVIIAAILSGPLADSRRPEEARLR